MPFGIEAGYAFLGGRLFIILLISGRESLSNQPTLSANSTTAERNAAALGLYGNNLEFVAIIPKLLFKVNQQWTITASYGTAAHGRNVAGGVVIAGGVLYEL